MYEIQSDVLEHLKMVVCSRSVVYFCFSLDLNFLHSDSLARKLQDDNLGKKGLNSVLAAFSGMLLKSCSLDLVDFS